MGKRISRQKAEKGLMRLFLTLTTMMMVLAPSFAWACRCYPPDDTVASKAYEEADIVIRAEIINPSKGFTQSGPLLTVNTIDVIKGENVPATLNLNYNNVPAACGSYFEKGQITVIGIYDTRDMSKTDAARGYGYRLMSSCQLDYIRYYVDHMKTQQETHKHEIIETE